MAQAMPCGEHTASLMAAHVADIESRLAELDKAFASGDGEVIAQQSQQLQRSLADSLVAFRQAEQAGLAPLSPDLRQRLKLAQSRVLVAQAAVHRASASIDRTLNVLFAREDEHNTYGSLGQSPAARALNAYR